MATNLQEKAERLSARVFLGGPAKDFEAVGRLQMITLLSEGLSPHSRVLDIGCGCLRGGYWLIHFLGPGCYCGIEPNQEMLETGIREFLEPDLMQLKQPRFDSNADFDSSVFRERFDFFVARSVWTHASKAQIQTMLDSFRRDSTENAVFLTSYIRAGVDLLAGTWRRDYQGDSWVGRSHVSKEPGMVAHSRKWVQAECRRRGLEAVELREGRFNSQIWLKITQDRADSANEA